MAEGTSQKVEFNGLVAGLATSAAAVLSQVEALLSGDPEAGAAQGESLSAEERERRISDGLAGARQLIDTLAVLEEKTRGNLSSDEQELLASSLSELRIHFVSVSNRPRPQGG